MNNDESEGPGGHPDDCIRLAHRLGLPYDPSMQDWPVEVVSGSELPAALALYESSRADLTIPELRLLLHVVFASMDERMRLGDPGDSLTGIFPRITAFVQADMQHVRPVVQYWLSDYWGSEPEMILPSISGKLHLLR